MPDIKEEKPIDAPKGGKKNFFLKHLWDFVLLAALAVGTSSFYIARAIKKAQNPSGSDIVATVRFEGQQMEILDSNGNNRNPFTLSAVSSYEEFEIQGRHGKLKLGIKHNAIAVVSSECPGQECVHEGWVSEANHPIICAHNGIFIDITSSDWGNVPIG